MQMTPRLGVALAIIQALLLAVFLLPASAQAAVETYELQKAESQLLFSCAATLHGIQGEAKEYQSEVQYDADQLHLNLPAEVSIAVAGMTTGNKLRDRSMRKMFSAKDHPKIHWQLTSWNCPTVVAGKAATCSGVGVLTIRRISKKMALPFEFSMKDKRLYISADTQVNLADFQLKAPAMIGLIKVDKVIHIHLDTVWARAE